MNSTLFPRLTALAILLAILIAACQAEREPLTVTAVLTLPAPLSTVEAPSLPTIATTATRTALSSPSPISKASAATPPVQTADASSLPAIKSQFGETYAVAFVTANDQLNVRAAPGANNAIVARLDPGESEINITAGGQTIDGSLWVPISQGNTQGWVNSRYLTGQMSEEEFCSSTAVTDLLQRLETAVAAEDSVQLASLVHPERGLRVRISWWNPENRIAGADLAQIFESPSVHDWGTEDGSGLPVSGTFYDIIRPLLQADLAAANDSACASILHGPTTGLVKLPHEYSAVNHVSYFRDAQHVSGFDWGSWAVGVEQWQSRYYISFLVHYGYEI